MAEDIKTIQGTASAADLNAVPGMRSTVAKHTADIGDVSKLETTSKNLVGAINEVKQQGGGGGGASTAADVSYTHNEQTNVEGALDDLYTKTIDVFDWMQSKGEEALTTPLPTANAYAIAEFPARFDLISIKSGEYSGSKLAIWARGSNALVIFIFDPSTMFLVRVWGLDGHSVPAEVLAALPFNDTDAPTDGKTYGRNAGDWVEVTGGGAKNILAYVGDGKKLPSLSAEYFYANSASATDGIQLTKIIVSGVIFLYAIIRTAYESTVVIFAYGGQDLSYIGNQDTLPEEALKQFNELLPITDAPQDSKTYGRKDGAWVEVSACKKAYIGKNDLDKDGDEYILDLTQHDCDVYLDWSGESSTLCVFGTDDSGNWVYKHEATIVMSGSNIAVSDAAYLVGQDATNADGVYIGVYADNTVVYGERTSIV